MRKTILTGLRVSSAVFVATGYLALAATPSYPLIVILIPLILFLLAPMGERLDKHFPAYRRITYWVSIVVLLAAIASIFFIQLLGGVTVLVMYIQAYTIMHQKSVRNYYHLYLMSFFLLLAACVMSPEPEIGVVMGLFLFSAVVALILLNLHKEMELNPERTPPVILRLDVRDLPLAIGPPRRVDLGIFASMAVVVLVSFLSTAALFYVTPRMQAGFLGRTDPSQFRPEITPTIELAGGGRIVPDQTPVMHVEFPEEPGRRFEGGMFWRISSLNQYNQSQWRRRPLAGTDREPRLDLYGASPLLPTRNAPAGVRATEVTRNALGTGRLVHQSIYMDSVPKEGVPALTLVQRMQCAPGTRNAILSWDDNGDFSVALARTGQRWLQYDAWSEIEEFTPQGLREAPDNYKDVFRTAAYETLTHQDLEPRTLELVKTIVAGKTTVYDKALAISAYFNSGAYHYTLDLPILPADHAVDTFIHETKMGHCELFSSAMALMLRAVGIPTRVVAGYRGGEWNPGDLAYIVRTDMAHLWVEVYFIGLGWVTFDPSPSDEGSLAGPRNWIARTMARYTLKAKMAWYRNVIAYDRGLRVDSLRNLAIGIVGLRSGFIDSLGEIRQYRSVAAIVLLGVLLAALLAGGSGLLLLRGHEQRTGTGPLTADQTRAIRLYQRLRRRLNILGTSPQGKTAEELSREIHDVDEAQAAPAIELINLYNEVRFGGRPLPWDRYARLVRTVKKFHFVKKTTA